MCLAPFSWALRREKKEPSGQHVLLYGCSETKSKLFPHYGELRMENDASKAGEAICCNDLGQSTRHIANGQGQFFTQGDVVHENCTSGERVERGHTSATKTFSEAKAMCDQAGLRLCHSQAELDTSCTTGCHFNYALAWIEAHPRCDTAGQCPTIAGSWVPALAEHNIACPNVEVVTGGGNCKTYCEDRNLDCLRAQDNFGFGDCTLDERHDRQDQSDHGCNQNWQHQVCTCGVVKVGPPVVIGCSAIAQDRGTKCSGAYDGDSKTSWIGDAEKGGPENKGFNQDDSWFKFDFADATWINEMTFENRVKTHKGGEFKNVYLDFSDGSRQIVGPIAQSGTSTLKFEGIRTSSVKVSVKDRYPGGGVWIGIAEASFAWK